MDVTEAVAERVDIIGALVGADTTVTVAVPEAAGTVHVARVEVAEAGVAVEVTGAVAGMEATDAEAGMMGATEAEAGVVAAETGAEEEMGAEWVCFAAW